MIWRTRIWRAWICPWLRMAVIIAVALGAMWVALKRAERAGGPSPTTVLGEAMNKAARQRELTP
jgi:hypothetical protein